MQHVSILCQHSEKKKREVEVEEVESQTKGEDSQCPLQPIQGSTSTLSNYIPDSENPSQSISITLEQTPFDQEWEEGIESQIDTAFNLPKTL